MRALTCLGPSSTLHAPLSNNPGQSKQQFHFFLTRFKEHVEETCSQAGTMPVRTLHAARCSDATLAILAYDANAPLS